MRVTFSAYRDEMERAAGSCATEAELARGRGEEELAAFMEGAACAVSLLPSCRSDEGFGTMVAAEFRVMCGEVA